MRVNISQYPQIKVSVIIAMSLRQASLCLS